MSMAKVAGTVFILAVGFAAAAAQNPSAVSDTAAEAIDIGSVKVVCVDAIAGDAEVVAVAREMVIAGLFGAKRFSVTEKCDKADAVLKGAVIERAEKNVRAESESIGFGAANGYSDVGNGGGISRFGAGGGSTGETLYSAKSGFSASVVLRLIDQNGTVIWAHTQDSIGGKVKGAIPDAVDRAVRQMLRAIERSP